MSRHEPPNNLPIQVTSFVGREREAAEVAGLLSTARLLTLTGAGGCGKTRLALRVAADLLPAYPDGVWLVELAALADSGLVARMAASVLGVREAAGVSVTDSLVGFLRDRRLLLVLDNCEHLVEAAAELVEALLRRCPGLSVLATSREPLNCAGESSWLVPSLAVPSEREVGEAAGERLIGCEAVRLFVERARAVVPGFVVTAENAAAVAEICRRLDGIPLAIELAAARARVFSVEQIAARLDDRFGLLTAGQRTALPRHRTLRAAMDWSYNLLAEPEQVLLRRLAVFAGGWSFEAAEAVCAGEGIRAHAMLDLLAQLVDKSLVIVEQRRGAARYRLLETIRQYAREGLDEAGESARLRDRHLAYFLRFAEEAEPKLRGPEERATVDRLAEEHDNLRAALEWALEADGEAALRLSGALAWFWWEHSDFVEGRGWLERALAASPGGSAACHPTGRGRLRAARMKALHGLGWLVQHQRESALARDLLGESLAIARELDDRWSVAWVLHALGRVAYFNQDPATARTLGHEGLEVAERVGDELLVAWALHLLGLAAHVAADYPAARAYYERSLAIRRRAGYREGTAVLLGLLGVVAFREAEHDGALAYFREALMMGAQGDLAGPWGVGPILGAFSGLAAVHGQPAPPRR